MQMVERLIPDTRRSAPMTFSTLDSSTALRAMRRDRMVQMADLQRAHDRRTYRQLARALEVALENPRARRK